MILTPTERGHPMKYFKWSILFIVILLLNGCTNAPPVTNDQQDTIDDLNASLSEKEQTIATQSEEISAQSTKIATLESEIEQLNLSILENENNSTESSTNLLTVSLDVLDALATENMTALSTIIHPILGVRFTPYGYIDVTTDLVFASSAVPTLLADTTLYTWGAYDGSGDPINLTTSDYFDDFVYDEDYLNPHIIGVNNIIGTGNSLINISTVYPSASFVEYHFTGFDPQYGGIDWSSLILAFENVAGDWKLIGIIHNQWTI